MILCTEHISIRMILLLYVWLEVDIMTCLYNLPSSVVIIDLIEKFYREVVDTILHHLLNMYKMYVVSLDDVHKLHLVLTKCVHLCSKLLDFILLDNVFIAVIRILNNNNLCIKFSKSLYSFE